MRGWGVPSRSVLLVAIGVVALGGCAELLDEDYYAAAAAEEREQLMPVPDPALLTPPRPPNCEGSAARSGGDSPYYASDDVASSAKLEADKECYRKAEIRARKRLKQLQAVTAQMVRAMQRWEQDDR